MRANSGVETTAAMARGGTSAAMKDSAGSASVSTAPTSLPVRAELAALDRFGGWAAESRTCHVVLQGALTEQTVRAARRHFRPGGSVAELRACAGQRAVRLHDIAPADVPEAAQRFRDAADVLLVPDARAFDRLHRIETDVDKTAIRGDFLDVWAHHAGNASADALLFDPQNMEASVRERVQQYAGASPVEVDRVFTTAAAGLRPGFVEVLSAVRPEATLRFVSSGLHHFTSQLVAGLTPAAAAPALETLPLQARVETVANTMGKDPQTGLMTGTLTNVPFIDGAQKARLVDEQLAALPAGALGVVIGDGENDIDMLNLAASRGAVAIALRPTYDTRRLHPLVAVVRHSEYDVVINAFMHRNDVIRPGALLLNQARALAMSTLREDPDRKMLLTLIEYADTLRATRRRTKPAPSSVVPAVFLDALPSLAQVEEDLRQLLREWRSVKAVRRPDGRASGKRRLSDDAKPQARGSTARPREVRWQAIVDRASTIRLYHDLEYGGHTAQ